MAIISKIQLKNKEGLIIDENITLDYNTIAITNNRNLKSGLIGSHNEENYLINSDLVSHIENKTSEDEVNVIIGQKIQIATSEDIENLFPAS